MFFVFANLFKPLFSFLFNSPVCSNPNLFSMRFKNRYILCKIVVNDPDVTEKLTEMDIVLAIRVHLRFLFFYHVEISRDKFWIVFFGNY